MRRTSTWNYRQWGYIGFNGGGSDTSRVPHGEPYAGKLHVRFDEGYPPKNGEARFEGSRRPSERTSRGVPLYSTPFNFKSRCLFVIYNVKEEENEIHTDIKTKGSGWRSTASRGRRWNAVPTGRHCTSAGCDRLLYSAFEGGGERAG